MNRTIRRFSLSLGLSMLPAAGLGFGPALAGNAPACAAALSGSPHAALVVDTGSKVSSYCVALGAASVSGIQLVQKAGQQFGLSYRLGFGGQAVCMLNGVGGPAGDDCLTGQSQFWGYWLGNGSGGWTWSSTGAGSVTVHDGDVQGWAWGSGIDGTTHQQPPATSLTDVCTTSLSPTPRPTPGGGHGGNGGGNGVGSGGGNANPSGPSTHPSANPSDGPSHGATHSPHERSPSPKVHAPHSGSAAPLGDPTRIAAAGQLDSTGNPPSGSPIGIGLAVAFIVLLGAGGWLRMRS
ncbi:MAG: hypothetical protein ABI828_08375, partial [Actinomycetota bacterium]